MEKWASLLKEIAKRAKITAKRFELYAKIKEQPVANINILEKNLNEIKKLVSTFPDSEIKSNLLTWTQEETEFIKHTKEEFRYRFGNELKELLVKDGLALKGQLPLLRVGFYSLKLDFDLGLATLYWGPEIQTIKSKISLSVQEIYKTLYSFDEQIKKRAAQSQDFLKSIHQAYLRYTMFNNLAHDSKILLTDLLSELVLISQPASFRADPAKDKFRDYSRIQFSYDLYNLKKSEKFEIGKSKLRLSVATFDATTDKAKSIWVPDNETGDGTYYSYITFEEKTT
jgi:hypothetical protein